MCTWTLEVSLFTLHLARWAMVSQSAVWLPWSSSPYRSRLYLLGAVITGGPRRKRFSHWAISLAQRIHSSWKLVQRKFKLCKKKKCYKVLKHDLSFEHLSHFSVFYFRYCFHLGASLCFKAETMTLFGECHMFWGDMAKALAPMSDDLSLMPPETNMAGQADAPHLSSDTKCSHTHFFLSIQVSFFCRGSQIFLQWCPFPSPWDHRKEFTNFLSDNHAGGQSLCSRKGGSVHELSAVVFPALFLSLM